MFAQTRPKTPGGIYRLNNQFNISGLLVEKDTIKELTVYMSTVNI